MLIQSFRLLELERKVQASVGEIDENADLLRKVEE
jgi:hypothetical protein